MTISKNFKKSFQIFVIFALVISLFSPYATQKSIAAEVISVEDAITNNSGKATVRGYIVGHIKSKTSVSRTDFPDDNNFAIADSPDETNTNKMLFVQLTSSYRSEFGLKSNPSNLEKLVEVTGSLEAYFTGPGLKTPTSMKFVENTPDKVAMVTATPEAGAVAEGTTVELATATADAKIYYTTDNSEPSSTSTEYTEAIVINEAITIKAIAVKDGLTDSDVSTFEYTIINENQVKEVKASPASGKVAAGTSVSLSTATDGATIHYTTDGSEPTEASAIYEEPIAIHEDTTIKAIAVKDNLEPSTVSTFTYTVEVAPTTISIAEARKQGTGEVIVKGIVTAKLKNTAHIQDETAAIAIYPVSSISANEGDEITVKGTLSAYNGLLQLQNPTVIGNPTVKEVPAPIILTGAELNEENESKLATVNNVKISGTAQNYNATDADGTAFIVRDENSNLGLEAGTTYQSITGIVQEFNGAFQIIPRTVADIVLDTTTLKEAIASPGSGTFTSAQTVTLSTSTAGAEIFYTLDGSTPDDTSTKYTSPITIDKTTTLKAIVKAQDGAYSKVSTFEYKITDALRIHDIQGEAHYSPMVNQNVSDIEGIVTYVMGTRFFMQDLQPDDNPNTSEGILVNKSGHGVVAGDIVKVSGKVEEYYLEGYDDRAQTDLPLTQIYASTVTKIAKGELPAPVIIDENRPNQVIDNDQFEQFDPEEDAIDYWESIEGMLVQVGNVKAIAPQEHGDLITLLENEETNTLHGGLLFEEGKQNPHRIHFRLEPNGSARDFEVATGDKFNGPITGVVSYSYQNYKIIVPLDTMKKAHVKGTTKPEVTTIVKAEDKLTIASYNLENFSNNSASDETPQSKVDKLARAIGTDMETPDIVGVTEVQDNNGTQAGGAAANKSYERLIAAIKARTGTEYKYLNIDPIDGQDGGAPNANIRVGFLYNPERVSIPEGLPAGDATTAVGYENGKLTLNPGRIDPNNAAFSNSRKPLAAQFIFKGEEVIVIANHWNSKSGDTPLFGQKQPPVYSSEIKRKKMAEIVYNFVQDVKTKNPDANIVSLGDFNDYEFTDALKIHEGTLMTNMINKVVPTSDRYTYVYQGNSQVLDHILVSNNLVNKTVIDILHINADFTDMAGRASDHDPVMVQIDLKASDETPIIEQKVFSINEFLTKKLTFTKPFVKVDLDGDSVITDGVFFQGQYIELDGAGVAEHTVTIKPNQPGAIVVLKATVQKLIIDGSNVKEIRGAENIKEIEYINGASPENIIFKNSEGAPIGDPSLPSKTPIVTLPISNKTVTEGEEISINLLDHFSDPNNDTLSFTATKGTVNGNTLTLSLSVGSHIVGVTATDGEYSVTTQFSVTVLAKGENNEYYATASGKTGSALRNALHEIISNQTILSYDQVWDALKITDEDPNNPNNVLLFYSGISRSKNLNGGNVGEWNREHVWAKSHGNFGTSKGPGTDIHHLRATDTQVNSSRGNLDFDYGGTSIKNCNLCKRDSDSFEPPDHVKGDVARMLFYMAIRYEPGDRVDLELNERVNNGKNPYHGKLSVLLEWHRKDPVDEIEKGRNEKIYKIQGNRNPFIDNPEWAMEIWN